MTELETINREILEINIELRLLQATDEEIMLLANKCLDELKRRQGIDE